MNSSFLNKIRYKKERVGVVRKDGKTYVKYTKTRRFVVSRKIKYSVLSLCILVALALGIKLIIYEYAAMASAAAETDDGLGAN